jgi:subtilisin family serine protease
MSLGAPVAVQQVRKAIQYAATKGAVCFVAAGNAGNTKEVFYPANYPETIAIGAIDLSFNRANFSNTGVNLDFMAPGVDIFSTVPDNWYATLSGTSMAQPFACGVAALLKSYVMNTPKLKNKVILETAENYRGRFKKHVVPVQNENYRNKKFYTGFGIIDPRLFVEAIDRFEKKNPPKDIRFLKMPH